MDQGDINALFCSDQNAPRRPYIALFMFLDQNWSDFYNILAEQQLISIESQPDRVAPLIEQIITIAKGDREALGFIPAGGYHDACEQGRLVVAVRSVDAVAEVVGFVLFGGIFPHARVYQVSIAPTHRRTGIASKLLQHLAERLEREGYMTLSARVANDLQAAQAFYGSNAFQCVRRVTGGKSRGRTILIYVRKLHTKDLLSALDEKSVHDEALALALRAGSPGEAAFYVIDLNVLFDLVRDRANSSAARRLFGAALAHHVRLVIDPEFLAELRRTTQDAKQDPILQMALQLPQLVAADSDQVHELATRIHRIVFEEVGSRQMGTPQSTSDCRHIAHAFLARAAAFITSDGALLTARNKLRREVGIDVASLTELLDLVPGDFKPTSHVHSRAADFELKTLSPDDVDRYCTRFSFPKALVRDFCRSGSIGPSAVRLGMEAGGTLAAICALVPPASTGANATMLLHCDPAILESDAFLDALFDRVLATATQAGPIRINLLISEIDSSGRIFSFARSRGFLGSSDSDVSTKVCLGRPITPATWEQAALAIERRTSLRLVARGDAVELSTPSTRKSVAVSFAQLEELLSPAIVQWPGREAVIQPIAHEFAGALLGTGRQHQLFESHEASFLSLRAYIGTARAASQMLPGRLIFFYESQRTGGQAAVLAVARIVDTLTVSKHALTQDWARRLVVGDVARFSTGTRALVTSFDNLLEMPRPCPLTYLRDIGGVGSKNLQTTTQITNDVASKILDYGWSHGPAS